MTGPAASYDRPSRQYLPQAVAPPPPTGGEEDGFDIHTYIRMFLRRWQVIVGTLVIGVGLSFVNLLFATPLYTATTELLIDPNPGIQNITPLVAEARTDAATMASEVRLIKSSVIAKRVIRKLNLHRDPEFGGTPAKAEAKAGSLWSTVLGWFGMGGDRADDVQVEAPKPAKMEDIDPDKLERLARAFSARTQVRRVRGTRIISISFTSADPEKAARIANAIANAYLIDQLEARFETTRRATSWLRDRLRELQRAVHDAERAVELYRAEHNLIGPKGQTPYDAQLERLNQELILAKVQMNEKKARLEQAQQVIRSGGKLTAIDAVARSDVVSKLRQQIANLAQREAELITRFTPKHPKVVNVRAERRDLQRQISLEAKRIINNLQNDYDIARKRVESVEQSLAELKAKTKGARAASIRLRELEREAAASRAVYEAFLKSFKLSSQQETLRTAESRVITPAIAPSIPSHPNKRRKLLNAALMFGALGFGLAFLLEKLDNSFKTGDQIETELGVAHLASVPKISDLDRDNNGALIPLERFVVVKALSPFAESIRALRMAIQLSNIDSPPQIVMITSSLPNEGKTVIAANLAQMATQAGARVLLIDADLRNPSLTRALTQGKGPGLVEILSHQVSPEQVILRDQTGFAFVRASKVSHNSAEILGSHTMKDFLEAFREHYDLILLDTSPVTPVVDARVLSQAVDSVVLVVEWDKTSRHAVREAIKNLRLAEDRLAGVVLNKVDMRRMLTYSGYGYGYGYGRYSQKYPHYYGTYGEDRPTEKA